MSPFGVALLALVCVGLFVELVWRNQERPSCAFALGLAGLVALGAGVAAVLSGSWELLFLVLLANIAYRYWPQLSDRWTQMR